MVSEQTGQRRGKEVEFDQVGLHDSEEKCKTQAYTGVTKQRMTGNKTVHNTDKNSKLEYSGQVR